MFIAGDRNCWGELFSRWVTVPSASVRAYAAYATSEPDGTLPSKQPIRDVHQATLAAGSTSFSTDDCQVILDDEGLFRLQVNGRALLYSGRSQQASGPVDGVCCDSKAG